MLERNQEMLATSGRGGLLGMPGALAGEAAAAAANYQYEIPWGSISLAGLTPPHPHPPSAPDAHC